MLKRLVLPAALLVAVSGAFAQQPAQGTAPANTAEKPAQQKLTPEQQQAIVQFRQRMVKNALGVAQTVDQGNIGSLWDQSSDTMKQAVTRDAFIAGVQAERAKAGKMESRKLALMFRSVSKGDKNLPAGTYFNVKFATKFSSNSQPMLETVSYHFDKDNQVRLSGYSLQPMPAPAKAASKSR